MSKDNLIISKDAAKTIGLNEAVLLEILNFNYKATKRDSFTLEEIQIETPFWEENELLKTLANLSAKGIIKTFKGAYCLVKQQENSEDLIAS